jgi:hypothetical protein
MKGREEELWRISEQWKRGDWSFSEGRKKINKWKKGLLECE